MANDKLKEYLQHAIVIATFAHNGQWQKDGKTPYIMHPLHVMHQVPLIRDKIVAVLHDILEDTKVTIKDIRHVIPNEDICNALIAITKLPNEPYKDYLHRVKQNPIACRVKMEDLIHNLDLGRLGRAPTQKDRDRWGKYAHALAYLSEGQLTHGS
jgi:GTP diphosphokinase / guanosine-3',5'-bis(diphosphate) 3'-diphosphatase